MSDQITWCGSVFYRAGTDPEVSRLRAELEKVEAERDAIREACRRRDAGELHFFDEWRAALRFRDDARAELAALRSEVERLLADVRIALGSMQKPMEEMNKRCAIDLPHDHGHLRALRSAMTTLQDAHNVALALLAPGAHDA